LQKTFIHDFGSPPEVRSNNLSEQTNNTEALRDSVFMRACRRETVPYTPIWLMRQAGRYMQEYRDVRARLSFLDLCKTPSLAAEVTVTAAERLGVDAAIIFADILLIIEPMGLQLEFSKGEGPVIHNPVRTSADVERLREVDDLEALGFVFAAIKETRAALRNNLPLIGFAGAPFTLASYIVEGGASRNYVHTKSLMYNDSGAWHAMMSLIARGLSKYLNAQIAAGAQAVQLFDSWVGALSPDDYREFVLPHTRAVIAGITPGVPVIHFGTGTSSLLELLREAGGDVIGLDWRVRLDEGWQRVGHDRAVMGNLDPVALFANRDRLRAEAKLILEQAAHRPGHIFNLGHGILPETPVENVLALIDFVHETSQESRISA
jgi:uroporphyrinogen decarboxylase